MGIEVMPYTRRVRDLIDAKSVIDVYIEPYCLSRPDYNEDTGEEKGEWDFSGAQLCIEPDWTLLGDGIKISLHKLVAGFPGEDADDFTFYFESGNHALAYWNALADEFEIMAKKLREESASMKKIWGESEELLRETESSEGE